MQLANSEMTIGVPLGLGDVETVEEGGEPFASMRADAMSRMSRIRYIFRVLLSEGAWVDFGCVWIILNGRGSFLVVDGESRQW